MSGIKLITINRLAAFNNLYACLFSFLYEVGI